MSLFRNETNLETVYNGCPICGMDVKGNNVYLYFCKNCNILFRKEDLVLDTKAIEKLLKENIINKFESDKDKIQIEEKTLKEKAISDKKKGLLKNLKETTKYYVSTKSNIIHMSNCPYGKNIKKENKIILKSLEGTEKYKKCKCMI
ncbi:MAG: hypothetical protein ACP5N1_00535 [Candidatus Woesearchaeota archaeon]